MESVTGIPSTKEGQSNPAKITSDSKQHPQEAAAVKDKRLPEKTEFEKLKEKAVSLQVAREHTLHFINNLPWKE